MGKWTEIAEKTYSALEKRRINKKYDDKFKEKQAENAAGYHEAETRSLIRDFKYKFEQK
jgi:hypothetical protein